MGPLASGVWFGTSPPPNACKRHPHGHAIDRARRRLRTGKQGCTPLDLHGSSCIIELARFGRGQLRRGRADRAVATRPSRPPQLQLHAQVKQVQVICFSRRRRPRMRSTAGPSFPLRPSRRYRPSGPWAAGWPALPGVSRRKGPHASPERTAGGGCGLLRWLRPVPLLCRTPAPPVSGASVEGHMAVDYY